MFRQFHDLSSEGSVGEHPDHFPLCEHYWDLGEIVFLHQGEGTRDRCVRRDLQNLLTLGYKTGSDKESGLERISLVLGIVDQMQRHRTEDTLIANWESIKGTDIAPPDGSVVATDYTRAESDLHRKYAETNLHGEWFALDEDDVAWLMSIDRL